MGWNLLILFAMGVVVGASGGAETAASVAANLYQLAILIPSLAVGVRRMHDTGHNGWWIICPFVNLALVLRKGDRGPNAYGPDPTDAPALPGHAEALPRVV